MIVMGIPLDRWMVYSMENPNLNWMISGALNFRKPPFVQIIDDPHFCQLPTSFQNQGQFYRVTQQPPPNGN